MKHQGNPEIPKIQMVIQNVLEGIITIICTV